MFGVQKALACSLSNAHGCVENTILQDGWTDIKPQGKWDMRGKLRGDTIAEF